jgi:hypothetical protein
MVTMNTDARDQRTGGAGRLSVVGTRETGVMDVTLAGTRGARASRPWAAPEARRAVTERSERQRT